MVQFTEKFAHSTMECSALDGFAVIACTLVCGGKGGRAIDLVRQLHLHTVFLGQILLLPGQEGRTRAALPRHSLRLSQPMCRTHCAISLHLVDRTPVCNKKKRKDYKKKVRTHESNILIRRRKLLLRSGRKKQRVFADWQVLTSGTERTSDKSTKEVLRSTDTTSEKVGHNVERNKF